jgi:hypothetical protein
MTRADRIHAVLRFPATLIGYGIQFVQVGVVLLFVGVDRVLYGKKQD